MMAALRTQPPSRFGDFAVKATRDYLAGTRTEGSTVTPLGIPQSDVVGFELEGGARVVVRPSGTEPKLKLYLDLAVEVGPHDDFADRRALASTQLDQLARSAQELVTSGA